MESPCYTAIPSEATVEQLSNYQLLVQLQAPSAWIFIPTRNEELARGYDASLRNHKVAILQYKRARSVNKNRVSIAIEVTQHATLLRNFPAAQVPYVFYGFSLYADYGELNNDFELGRGPLGFVRTIYFSAHDLPLGASTVRCRSSKGRPRHVLEAFASRRKLSNQLASWTGFELVYYLKACTLGRVGPTELFGTMDEETGGSRIPRTCVLRYRID